MPRQNTAGRSRRSRSAESRSPSGTVLGVDLGATKVVSAWVAPDGSIVERSRRHLHANDGPDGVIQTLVASVRECQGTGRMPGVSSLGVAVAAQVDPKSGTIVHAPNLGWRNIPLARRLSEEFAGASVVVLNDARAATLAEWQLGAGRGVSDLFCLILGTGVGGSAVVGGRLLEGGTHALGEVGHITVVAGGRKCHCPNVGCLEAYVGGWAIAERAREAVESSRDEGAALVALAGSQDQITARTVFEAARARDPLASRLVRETEAWLADGAVSIANSFNPNLIVLGGGLVAGHPEFAAVIQKAVRDRCQPPAATARVVIGHFGEDAPLVGGAEAARRAGGPLPST